MRSFLNGILAGIVAGIIITITIIAFIIIWKDIVAPDYFQKISTEVINSAQLKRLMDNPELVFIPQLFANTGGLRNYITLLGANIILGFLWGLGYVYLRKSLPRHWIFSGLTFGLFAWLLGQVPVWALLAIHTQFPRTVLGGWALGGVVACLLGGLAVGFIYNLLQKETSAWRREKEYKKEKRRGRDEEEKVREEKKEKDSGEQTGER